MAREALGNILRRALDRLPEAEATLGQLVRFCNDNSPVGEFRQRWGAEYSERARDLWGRSTHAFSQGVPIEASPDELLLCMAYDVAVAPYIGVPEEISHRYLHAVLRQLRDATK